MWSPSWLPYLSEMLFLKINEEGIWKSHMYKYSDALIKIRFKCSRSWFHSPLWLGHTSFFSTAQTCPILERCPVPTQIFNPNLTVLHFSKVSYLDNYWATDLLSDSEDRKYPGVPSVKELEVWCATTPSKQKPLWGWVLLVEWSIRHRSKWSSLPGGEVCFWKRASCAVSRSGWVGKGNVRWGAFMMESDMVGHREGDTACPEACQ